MIPKPARYCASAPLLVLLCLGCQPDTDDFRHQLFAFGTVVTIDLFDVEPEINATAMIALEQRIKEIDLNWYPWRRHADRPAGELSRINAAIAAGESIKVSPPLAELLRRAAALENQSGGRFNPTIGALTELWGFHDAESVRSAPPDRSQIAHWLSASVSSGHIQWNGNVLRSRSPNVMIDLGGIAKGSILGQLAAILSSQGIDNAIIDLGGDLTVVGSVRGRPARIGIRAPRSDEVLAWLEVGGGETVVTSGDYERFFEHEGQRFHHVLDPRSGYPVQHTISATVVHEDAVLADAAATALMVAGPEEFDELCKALGLDWALIVTASGDLSLTVGMEKRLEWINR